MTLDILSPYLVRDAALLISRVLIASRFVASAVNPAAFLPSDEAQFLDGRTLVVDGGAVLL